MNLKLGGVVLAAAIAGTAGAESASGRAAFMQQQAVAAYERINGQMDVLANNQADLGAKVEKLESMHREIAELRAEIEALRSEVNSLKASQGKIRSEVVNDLSGKIAKIQATTAPAPAPAPRKPPANEKVSEYVVQSGDTLSLIAKAFDTKVSHLLELNNLKSGSVLRVGQKITVPTPKKK